MASRRLTVRALCVPLSVPTQSSSDTPRKIPSSHLGSTLATPFVTPGNEEDLFSNMRQCSCELAPAVLPSGPLLHLFTIATEYFTSQVGTGCPPGNSCPKRLTRQAKFVLMASFQSFTAFFCQSVALRIVQCPLFHLDINTCQFQRCRC